jgi:hypothetical protein
LGYSGGGIYPPLISIKCTNEKNECDNSKTAKLC